MRVSLTWNGLCGTSRRVKSSPAWGGKKRGALRLEGPATRLFQCSRHVCFCLFCNVKVYTMVSRKRLRCNVFKPAHPSLGKNPFFFWINFFTAFRSKGEVKGGELPLFSTCQTDGRRHGGQGPLPSMEVRTRGTREGHIHSEDESGSLKEG
jgi:hypothetical protein